MSIAACASATPLSSLTVGPVTTDSQKKATFPRIPSSNDGEGGDKGTPERRPMRRTSGISREGNAKTQGKRLNPLPLSLLSQSGVLGARGLSPLRGSRFWRPWAKSGMWSVSGACSKQ